MDQQLLWAHAPGEAMYTEMRHPLQIELGPTSTVVNLFFEPDQQVRQVAMLRNWPIAGRRFPSYTALFWTPSRRKRRLASSTPRYRPVVQLLNSRHTPYMACGKSNARSGREIAAALPFVLDTGQLETLTLAVTYRDR